MTCRATTYAALTLGGVVTYGFRCAEHNIASRRYSTQELRDERLRQHQEGETE